MSSVSCSHGIALATAMAVSGTVILLALRLQKPPLRPCLSSSEGKKKKKKKRVQFAKDVVNPTGNGEEFRRRKAAVFLARNSSSPPKFNGGGPIMPENRVALYNGILRDRVIQRLAYSY